MPGWGPVFARTESRSIPKQVMVETISLPGVGHLSALQGPANMARVVLGAGDS